MRIVLPDPDLYEPDIRHTPCTVCHGDLKKCNGGCNGSTSYGQKLRDPAEVARIKAERQKKQEDEILTQAAAIRARRGL